VESSALRVLRALEEEGEKSKSAAIAVKVPTEIAIYVLNQKRHELTRLETEHRMEITFLPQDDMPAGQFEIDRLRSRDPGERPRSHAVGIEAGFVHSDEPEPEYVEEVDEEDEIVVSRNSDDSEEESSAPEAKAEGRGEREGGRDGRRRRRGGRGRSRSRDGEAPRGDQPRGEDQPRAESATADGEDAEGVETAEGAPNAGEGQETAEGSRRRRRRRGRRGGRDRERPHDQVAGEQQENGQAQPVADAYVPDRFGEPDDIDTTPSTSRASANAPSAPAWSLASEPEIDTTPGEDGKPVKKGWWQKTFGGEK
jgi:ribonuclease E